VLRRNGLYLLLRDLTAEVSNHLLLFGEQVVDTHVMASLLIGDYHVGVADASIGV
jgi:hypothetical protein